MSRLLLQDLQAKCRSLAPFAHQQQQRQRKITSSDLSATGLLAALEGCLFHGDTHSLTHSLTHTLADSILVSLTVSLIVSLTVSLIVSLTPHSLTYSLSHLLT